MKAQVLNSDIADKKLKLIFDKKVPDSFTTKLNVTYEWIWVTSSDVNRLLAIRNAEHVLSNMRNTSPVTREGHLKFLMNYALLPRLDFVLIDKDKGKYVGGMNISLTNHGYEIGKYIGNAEYLGEGIAYQMSMSFLRFINKNVNEIGKICAVTKMDNYKNINLNFKLGFKIIRCVEQNYWLMEIE